VIVAIYHPTTLTNIHNLVSKAGFFIGKTAINRADVFFFDETPSGSSFLFSTLAESGRIKDCKNGSYRMKYGDA